MSAVSLSRDLQAGTGLLLLSMSHSAKADKLDDIRWSTNDTMTE